jgi:alkylation response protein AidB-like acyl-CoA dehydrogenase
VVVSAEDVLPGAGAAALDRLRQHVVAADCAMAAGIAAGALKLTAEYTSKREQFGRPIAAFQAVTMQAADAYIDVEAMRATALRAAWLLSVDRPAAREVSIAKFWAGEGGHRVLSRAQHLHGGIGVDTEYPLYRYLLSSKRAELAYGSATWHLARLAAMQTVPEGKASASAPQDGTPDRTQAEGKASASAPQDRKASASAPQDRKASASAPQDGTPDRTQAGTDQRNLEELTT